MIRSILSLLVLTSSLFSLAEEAYQVGMLQDLHGDVTIDRGQATLPGKRGMSILAGDSIETDDHSSARVVTLDKNIFSISENSSFKFTQYPAQSGHVLLNLEGTIHAEIIKKYNEEDSTFRIVTPTGVTGVRGTEFLLEGGSRYTQVTTFEGTVTMGESMQGHAIQNSVVINKGQQFKGTPDKLTGKFTTKPRALPAHELNALRTRAKQMLIHSEQRKQKKAAKAEKKAAKKEKEKEKRAKKKQSDRNQ